MKAKSNLPKGGKHSNPRPRLRARHLSTVGKSAYGTGPGGPAALPAFPPGPAGAGAPAFPDPAGAGAPAFPDPAGAGAPAFPDPGAGGADSAALAGPSGGPPGM